MTVIGWIVLLILTTRAILGFKQDRKYLKTHKISILGYYRSLF